MRLFFFTFIFIFIIELADKSRLAGVLLSSTYSKSPASVFWGMTLAYLVLEGLGVLLGVLLSVTLPPSWIHYGTAAVLTGMGLATFFLDGKAEHFGQEFIGKFVNWSPVMVSFFMIALFEIASRTQFAVISLTAFSRNPIIIYSASMCAFILLNIVTISVGKKIMTKISYPVMKNTTAILFILAGFTILTNLFL